MQTVSWQIQNKASMKHCSWFFPFPIYPMQKCNIFIYYLSYKGTGTKWFTGLKIIKQSTFCTMVLYKTRTKPKVHMDSLQESDYIECLR